MFVSRKMTNTKIVVCLLNYEPVRNRCLMTHNPTNISEQSNLPRSSSW